MIEDPRVTRLAGEAQAAADNYSLYRDLVVQTDRKECVVVVGIPLQGPIPAIPPDLDVTAYAYLPLDRLEELLRDLSAAHADLCKLMEQT